MTMPLSFSSVPLLFSMPLDQLCIEDFPEVPSLWPKPCGNSAEKKEDTRRANNLCRVSSVFQRLNQLTCFLLRNWKGRKRISTSEKHYYSCIRGAFLIQNRLQQSQGCCRLHGSLSWRLIWRFWIDLHPSRAVWKST